MSILPEDARVADLCRRFNARWLDLFGSAVIGRFDPITAILILLVEFAPMPPGAYAPAYSGLRDALEAEYVRPIDLVTEAALANPYLIRRIAAESGGPTRFHDHVAAFAKFIGYGQNVGAAAPGMWETRSWKLTNSILYA